MIMSFNQLHEEVTRLVNAISQGGGGGGSTVSVVSKRNTGENIADITVNNTTTQLYAPDSASDISFDPTIKGVYSGTNTQSVVDEITDDISSLNDTITKTVNITNARNYAVFGMNGFDSVSGIFFVPKTSNYYNKLTISSCKFYSNGWVNLTVVNANDYGTYFMVSVRHTSALSGNQYINFDAEMSHE